MARPVVASDITGTIDVVRSDVDAQLFALDDLPAAARRIARFIRDPSLAEAVAHRGRDHVNAAFSVRETRLGLIAAYDAALRFSA